jgi:hypothetical protein
MSNSDSAREATARAIHGYNHWRADALDHVGKALEADPSWPMAHVVKGLALVTGRNVAYAPAIAASLAAARAGEEALSPLERRYVDALEALAGGRLTEAVVHYEDILAQKPDDLFAHRLAQQ